MKPNLYSIALFISFLIASALATVLKNENESARNWEVICSILACKSVLDKCVLDQCSGAYECRNCVFTQNQICSRCVDSILNEQENAPGGMQTIICDSSNSLHETTCNFYCRMKGRNNGKCEQTEDYSVCNCNENISTTTTSTTTLAPIQSASKTKITNIITNRFVS
jgi:hypothetical protein